MSSPQPIEMSEKQTVDIKMGHSESIKNKPIKNKWLALFVFKYLLIKRDKTRLT
jgi:hypothetical protein